MDLEEPRRPPRRGGYRGPGGRNQQASSQPISSSTPSEASDSNNPTKTQSRVSCFLCGSFNHYKKDCPLQNTTTTQQGEGNIENNNNNSNSSNRGQPPRARRNDQSGNQANEVASNEAKKTDRPRNYQRKESEPSTTSQNTSAESNRAISSNKNTSSPSQSRHPQKEYRVKGSSSPQSGTHHISTGDATADTTAAAPQDSETSQNKSKPRRGPGRGGQRHGQQRNTGGENQRYNKDKRGGRNRKRQGKQRDSRVFLNIPFDVWNRILGYLSLKDVIAFCESSRTAKNLLYNLPHYDLRPYANKVNGAILFMLADRCPNLKSIDIRGCKGINEASIKFLIAKSPKLKILLFDNHPGWNIPWPRETQTQTPDNNNNNNNNTNSPNNNNNNINNRQNKSANPK